MKKITRNELHEHFFYDMAQFINEYFSKRNDEWDDRKDEIGRLDRKDMNDEQKDFKDRHQWHGPPVSVGICKIFIFPGILHGSGHSVNLIFRILIELIDRGSFGYKMMVRSIACFDGYTTGGDICAGTELLYRMVHELSCLFYVLLFVT